jgi:tetratricopeptide (TPR) repeat protein
MRQFRAFGWLAAGAFSILAGAAGAQPQSGGECIQPTSQQGVLLQSLVEQLARDIETPRKSGNHARVLEIAGEAQDTRLCSLPANIPLAQAEALVALERPCDAAGPLDQYFASATPGAKGYGTAEDLFEQVSQARESGLCEKPLGGVALAEPTAEAAPSHDDVRGKVGDGTIEDGSQRDNYRGGELAEGRMAYDNGNYGRAAELFGIVIRQAPDSFEGYFRRAQANAKLGDTRAASADYAKAMELAPTRGYIVTDFARFLASRNRLEDAIALYNTYLERYPNDLDALRERASARQKAGLVDLALEDYSGAIDMAPGNSQLLLQRGYVYHDNGKFTEAAADYSAAIRAGARSADVYYRRGLAYYALNKPDPAIADMNAAIAANPKLAAAYSARATLHQYKGNGAAAISDFGKVIDLQPENAGAYVDRGKEYQRQLNGPAAIADYSAALRYDPGNLDALKGRAMIYQQQGNFSNALDDLTQIINRDYADADAYARRGWLYYAWKDFQRAMDDFDKALLIDPNGKQAQLGRQACLEAFAAAEKAAAEAARRR